LPLQKAGSIQALRNLRLADGSKEGQTYEKERRTRWRVTNARQLTAGHFVRFVRRVPITQTAQEIGTEQTNALALRV